MDKDNLSDERLVSLHQQKRTNAFFIIYARYKNYGYAVIYRTLEKYNLTNALLDERDAILYDSIMEALDAFEESRGTFRKLISTILTNRTTNTIRKFKKDPISDYISIDTNNTEGNELLFSDSLAFADKEESPQQKINLDYHNKKVVTNYHGVYKRRIKKMVELREEGYTYKEIAKAFKTTERAVRGIFYRVKRRINLTENNKIKK